MAETYTRAQANWLNNQAGGTPINAASLNTIESGIARLYNLVNVKGDLIVATADNTLERQAAGANDTVLVADGVQTTGIKWTQIGNAQVAAGAAIAYSKLALAGSIVPGDLAATAWSTYVPALTASVTNPTLGTGSTATGRYLQLGKLVLVDVFIQFGTAGTAAGSGNYAVSLPVNTNTTITVKAMGEGYITDAGVDNYIVVPVYATTSTVNIVVEAGNFVTNAAPFAWGASDSIQLGLRYEAA